MRKEQLDGLRFVLLLMVFATHYAPNPLSVGYLGYALPVFFVMSGFLITNVLLSADAPSVATRLKTFYLRRILRICPAYYLVVGLLIAMGSLSYPAYYLSYLLNIKLFIASLAPSAAFEKWFVQGWRQESMHLWSLSVEEQFYVLYPILLYLTSVRYRTVLLFVVLLASIAARLWLMSVFPRSFFGTLLPVCAEYFIWGCLFSCLEHKKSLSSLSPSWTVTLAAIAAVGLIITEFQLRQNGFLQFTTSNFQTPIAMAMGFFIWGLWSIDDRHVLARILTRKPFVYFGAMSYTLYLVHLLALDIYQRFPIDLPFSDHTDAVVGSFVLSLVMAMSIWHLFEKPIYSLKRYLPYAKNS
ncbi:MAG: acyltransferase family protein [Gammaproteobacteria bacterium]